MDLLKQWDEIDSIPEEEELPRFVSYITPFASELEQAIRKGAIPEKTFGGYEAVFALLAEFVTWGGPMNEGSSRFLAAARKAFSLPEKSPEELERYGLFLRGKGQAHYVEALSLALRFRKNLKTDEAYDDFVKGLWLLAYQKLPLTEEGYQALYRFVDPRLDVYPSTLQDALRDEGR